MDWISLVLPLCFMIGLLTDAELVNECTTSAVLGPIVTTKAGSFQGLEFIPPGQNTVYAFLGIPYAEPPTGPLRFKKPQPIGFIEGVFKATKKPPACFQPVFDDEFPWHGVNSSMSEDCLYLNIWTPKFRPDEDELKPVMVWIHGGGYFTGCSSMEIYDGQVIATLGDVVVVTLNYRLGPLGLLSTLTDDVDTNAALRDQLLALQWVQTNIENFGGDPQRVTLFGESVGGMCTGFLALSPLSRGLFHRIIVQSGSPYSHPMQSPSQGVEAANRLADYVGCANETHNLKSHPKDVVDCLRRVPAEDLITDYYKKSSLDYELLQLTFRVQFEDDVMPKHPIEILKSKDYPMYDVFVGVTKDEGSIFFPVLAFDTYKQILDGKPVMDKSLAAKLLKRFFFFQNSYALDVEKIVDFYLKGVEDNNQESLARAVYEAIGDPLLVCPTTYFAEKYSERGGKVQFYRFDQIPSLTPWPEWMGAGHADELQFLFGWPVRYQEKYKVEEQQLSRYVIRTWTDFAKSRNLTLINGEPWPTFSRADPKFATFHTKKQIIATGERKAQCDFWRQYFEAQ